MSYVFLGLNQQLLILVPNAILFTIRIGYINGGVERLTDYVDYCCGDQISRIEMISMAMEFNLPVEGCSIWWVAVVVKTKG